MSSGNAGDLANTATLLAGVRPVHTVTKRLVRYSSDSFNFGKGLHDFAMRPSRDDQILFPKDNK